MRFALFYLFCFALFCFFAFVVGTTQKTPKLSPMAGDAITRSDIGGLRSLVDICAILHCAFPASYILYDFKLTWTSIRSRGSCALRAYWDINFIVLGIMFTREFAKYTHYDNIIYQYICPEIGFSLNGYITTLPKI